MVAGAEGSDGADGPDGGLPLLVRRPVDPKAPPRRFRLPRALRLLPLIPVLLITGAVVGITVQPPGLRIALDLLGLKPGAGTADPIAVPPAAAAPAPVPVSEVVGLGRIEPASRVVTVGAPFGAGDAAVAEILVDEGDVVARGDVLARLDNKPLLESAVAAAEASVAAREAALEQTRAAVAASRAEAEASLSAARAASANAEAEFARAETLQQRGIATSATLDQARAARDAARREVERLTATLSRFDGPIEAQPDVRVAASNLATARAERDRAAADLSKAEIRAPLGGTVLTLHAQPGERLGADGLLNMADLGTMTVRAEIYQTRIGDVDVGQPATVTAETLPSALQGRVERIGLEVGRQTLIDASPAANTDARVVTVTIALDPASSAVARRFTNLEVVARIAVGAGS